MRRLLLIAAFLPAAAFGQLQLFQYDGTTLRPVGSVFDLGLTAVGDTQSTRFRVLNLSVAPAAVQTISLSGPNVFALSPPTLPYILAPQNTVDFHVSFTPTASQKYSVTLSVNSITTILTATGIATAQLSVDGAPLTAGAIIDFGKTERGTSVTKTFSVSNPSSANLTVNSVVVGGAAFSGPSGIDTPLSLAPGTSANFQVTFQPQTAQPAQGTLTLDQRVFNLTGVGLDPPLPKAVITLDSAIGASAEQMHVSIALAATSQVIGSGTLTMEFQPSNNLPDDAAIQFLSGPRRVATVNISPGDSSGKFGALSSLGFQTGTTAGTIIFTLTMPNSSDRFRLPIAPAPVNVDTATTERRVNDLDVSISGFDNTHSLSQLSFTFYDTSGKAMPQGAIKYDATADFQRYFTSAQAAGGSFLMRASFPVTGDATTIGGVDVQITNSAGVTSTQRLTF